MRKVCAQAGCKNITTARNCPKCQSKFDMRAKEQAKKRARKSSGANASNVRGFYGSKEWKSLRDQKLRRDPLCQDCLENGVIRSGQDVDHIVEVKDDYSRRLDMSNLRTLCRSCHMHKTHKEREMRKKDNRSNESRW